MVERPKRMRIELRGYFSLAENFCGVEREK